MEKTKILVIAWTAALLAFPMRLRAEAGVSDHEIRIGVCSVFSGPIKDVGDDELSGAKAYLDYVNGEQGGVLGRKILLVTHDDEYDPEKAVACFNQMQSEDVFMGAFFAGAKTAARYVEMAEDRKFPIVGIIAPNEFLYEPFKRYIFSVRATARDEVAAEIDHLWEDLGLHRYGVIFQNDALGASGLRGVEQALKRKGSKPVILGSFPTNSKDVDGAIQIVRAENPDVVFIVGSYFSAVEVLKRSHDAGWKPVFVVTPGREEIIQKAGPAAEGVIYSLLTPPPEQTQLSGVVLFRRLMKKYSKAEINNKTEEGFIHAMIVVEGLKRAGKDLDRDKFIQAMESIHSLDLGFGPGFDITFSPTDHQGFKRTIFGVVHDGRLKVFTDWKKAIVR